ncbi:MAG: Ig-like domain-containing protein, partial [Telluria sp.]
MALSASAADTDGTIARVYYYRDATLIGSATVAPYALNWTGAAAGTYSVTARAQDDKGGLTTSAPITVVVKPNVLPAVALTAPAAGGNYIGPATIAMSATASDSDGTIAKVAYYRDATLIGSATTAPYAVNWVNAAAGTYSLTARATDNKGGVTTSSAVAVVVKPNILPTVSISTPASNATFAAPGVIPFQANAADSDGTISKVVYYNGAAVLATATVAPYTFNWSNVAAGSYVITAKATDNKGGVTTSAPVNVTVNPNVAPSVAITSPTATDTFVAPVALTLNAAATDNDGRITKVEFYGGALYLGVDTTAPFSFTWPNAPAGNHSVTARASDDKGAVTTSAAVIVTVKTNVLPTVSVTSGSTLYGPGTVTLTASAADSDGTVAKVAFYNGSTLIGTSTTVPFSIVWANVALGNYSISARATDDKNGTTISAGVDLAVKAAPVPSVSITAPANNASYIAPATLTFTAAATVAGDTISKVEYISGVNLIGTATAPPYTVTLTNVVPGNYAVTAKATGSFGGTATSSSIGVIVTANAAPTVSMTASPTTATAPAAITLTAAPADSDGTIGKVEFFNGATLLATVTQAPYSYAWTGVAAGAYELSAKAFDNLGLAAVSAPTSVTVTAPPSTGTSQVFFIYSDQINTAREITNAAGVKVWQADPDPFGANLPDENPAGQGTFTYNPRFPGQYFDRETGLHYNYFRDYDPQTGRYVQSDPIGLDGGINTY